MTWTKLDDNVYDSPAMVKAGEDAADLYVRGLVYCNKHLTDGRLEAEVLSVLTRRRTADQSAAALVRVGAWAVHPDGGWTVANFHEHNPAAEDVIAKRAALAEKRANAGKIGGKRSGQARSNEAKPKQSASDGRSKPEAIDDDPSKQTGSNASDPVEPPSRPVPSSSPSGEGSAPAREEPTPSSHGPATTATGRSLLDAFRDATGSRATLVGNMAEERGLADMLARLAPTAAEVTAMGAALGEVAAWWPQGKRPAPKHVTLRDLAGFRGKDGAPEWGPLSALVAHVRAKARPVDRKAALAAAMLSADPWVAAAARAGHLLHEEEA